MEAFTIRRTWLYLWLVSWLMSLDYLTGMTFKVILFLTPFLLLTSAKKEWILLLLVIRLFLMPQITERIVEAELQMHPIYQKEGQVEVHLGQKKFLLYGDQTSSQAKVKLLLTPFSKDRRQFFSEYDYQVSRGYAGKAKLLEISDQFPVKEPLRSRLLDAALGRSEVFKEEKTLAFSLLFGSKDVLGDEEKENLMGIGVMHLFVLSGLHFGIYERLLEKLLKKAYAPKIMRTALVLVVFFGLNYLSGFHPSSLRFLVLYILKEIDFYRRVEMDRWERFSLAGLIILLINPAFATSLSYILGICAHGCLLFFKERKILMLQLLLLPLQLLFHGVFSPIYLVYNFALIMIMPVLLVLLWIGFIITPLAFLATWLLSGMRILMDYLLGVHIFRLTIIIPTPFIYVLLGAAALIALFQYQNKWFFHFFKGIRVQFVVVLLILLSLTQYVNMRELRSGFHLLNVYQGDSMLIFSDSGETLLIDTGNNDILFDHLRNLGVFEIDHLIITHLDDDHSKFKDDLPAKKRYTTPYAPMQGAALLAKGSLLEVGDVRIEVLSPEKDLLNDNDNSLVLRVEQGGITFLLTGDVGGEHHREEWNRGVDVLKFSHHGSIHSLNEETMRTLRPKITLLSYGRNRYGHPAEEVTSYFSYSLLHHTFLHHNLQISEKGYRRY